MSDIIFRKFHFKQASANHLERKHFSRAASHLSDALCKRDRRGGFGRSDLLSDYRIECPRAASTDDENQGQAGPQADDTRHDCGDTECSDFGEKTCD